MKRCISKRHVLSVILSGLVSFFSQANQEEVLRKRLFDAVSGGNAVQLASALLDQNVRRLINDQMRVSTGRGELWLVAPLHIAAYKGLEDIARVLIQYGANVNVLDAENETPLHFAAARGHMGLARHLLDRGARVNAQDSLSETPLHEAVGSKSVGVVMLLLGRGADLNVRDMRGWTPLHKLVVEQIIPLKSELETMGFLALAENGQGAADYRAKQRALERAEVIARALIGRGAQVNEDIIRSMNQAGQRGLAEQLIREELKRVQRHYSI